MLRYKTKKVKMIISIQIQIITKKKMKILKLKRLNRVKFFLQLVINKYKDPDNYKMFKILEITQMI